MTLTLGYFKSVFEQYCCLNDSYLQLLIEGINSKAFPDSMPINEIEQAKLYYVAHYCELERRSLYEGTAETRSIKTGEELQLFNKSIQKELLNHWEETSYGKTYRIMLNPYIKKFTF